MRTFVKISLFTPTILCAFRRSIETQKDKSFDRDTVKNFDLHFAQGSQGFSCFSPRGDYRARWTTFAIKIATVAWKMARKGTPRMRTQSECTDRMGNFRETRSPHSALNSTSEDRISDPIRGHDFCSNVRSACLSLLLFSTVRAYTCILACVRACVCVCVCVSFARFHELVSPADSVNGVCTARFFHSRIERQPDAICIRRP